MRVHNKPVYLNLFQLHLPLTGWVSILHRLSGALLFVLLPLGVWAFSVSLTSEAGFARVSSYLSTPYTKALVLFIVAALAQHFFAGLRHLAMDAHYAMGLRAARATSIGVLLATGVVVLLVAWKLFG